MSRRRHITSRNRSMKRRFWRKQSRKPFSTEKAYHSYSASERPLRPVHTISLQQKPDRSSWIRSQVSRNFWASIKPKSSQTDSASLPQEQARPSVVLKDSPTPEGRAVRPMAIHSRSTTLTSPGNQIPAAVVTASQVGSAENSLPVSPR